jgi:hypothetical protein
VITTDAIKLHGELDNAIEPQAKGADEQEAEH